MENLDVWLLLSIHILMNFILASLSQPLGPESKYPTYNQEWSFGDKSCAANLAEAFDDEAILREGTLFNKKFTVENDEASI